MELGILGPEKGCMDHSFMSVCLRGEGWALFVNYLRPL